jgi:transketolase
MKQAAGPSALVLTRQKLPVLDPARTRGAARGAYILEEAGAAPKLILIATGSEVHLALAARTELEVQGIPTRVVSMPCWEVFRAQPAAYREEVLPAAVRARVSIEAGVTFGWERWVGEAGASIGLDHFGASAPAEVLFKEFGFTVENVVATAKRLLQPLVRPGPGDKLER